MKESRLALLAPAIVGGLVLPACSSGGSGGGGTPAATINATNATEVAKSVTTAMTLIGFEETADFTSYETASSPCQDGGVLTAGFDIDNAPIGQASTGDRFTVTASDCAVGSVLSDGSVVVDFNSVSGNPDTDATWEIDVDTTFTNFVLTIGSASIAVDAAWNQSLSVDGDDAEYALSGDFETTVSGSGQTVTAALDDFVLTCDFDAASGVGTYTIDGSFRSSELGGTVTVTTLAPVVVLDGDANPSSGSVRIDGANDSTMTLTAIDDVFVQLQVDANGDGDLELDVTVEWDDFG